MERLDRFAPPGMGTSGLRRWTLGAILISAFFSMSFLVAYVSELADLTKAMEQPVFPGLTMKPFKDLILVPMLLFRVAPLVPLLHIPGNYLYFIEESKSIYLMKRINNPLEMHLRCLALPVAGAVLVIGAGLALYFVYLLVYNLCTPEILLPASL